MPSFRELLSQTKQEIDEIEPSGAEAKMERATFLDHPEFTTTLAPLTFAVPDPDAPLQLPIEPEPEPEVAAGEHAPTITPTLAPNPLIDFLAAMGDFEASLDAASYRWTDPSEHVLQRSATVLTRRFDARIVFHGRWLQPVPPRDAAQPLLVQAGPRFGEIHQLEGTLGITLGRYLHFRAQLVYREPGFGQAPVALPHAVEPAAPPSLPREVAGYMVLDESRRMRSEEVHYLDHPKLGIIVRVDPVEIPEELQLRFDALEEGDD